MATFEATERDCKDKLRGYQPDALPESVVAQAKASPLESPLGQWQEAGLESEQWYSAAMAVLMDSIAMPTPFWCGLSVGAFGRARPITYCFD